MLKCLWDLLTINLKFHPKIIQTQGNVNHLSLPLSHSVFLEYPFLLLFLFFIVFSLESEAHDNHQDDYKNLSTFSTFSCSAIFP